MSKESLLYKHFVHLAQYDSLPCLIMEPQALLNSWLPAPPAETPQAQLAALDMALACLYQKLEDYFNTNAFADRLAAAADLLAAAKQEAEDLTVQQLAAELTAALSAADAACGEFYQLVAAETEQPLS